MNNKITIKNLSKTFNSGEESIEVFNIDKLSFKNKDLIAITGASGSGKSTLLQILAGLDTSTSGDVIIEGSIAKCIKKKERMLLSDLNKFQTNKLRRNHFGFIYQKNFLIKDLNVLDNLLLVNDNKEKALHLLDRVGMSSKIKNTYTSLSGGERQRVSICRSLMNDPKFVFADEPTGSLDYKNKDKIWDLFLELKKENDFGLIMVTHDLNLADSCNVIHNLSNGKITTKTS